MGLSITGNKDSEWFSVCAPFSSFPAQTSGFLEAQAIPWAPFKPSAFWRLKTVGRVQGGPATIAPLGCSYFLTYRGIEEIRIRPEARKTHGALLQ